MTVKQLRRLHSGTVSRAYLPPAELRKHLLCVIERNTSGCDLYPLQAFTYVPASPNLSITWFWKGQTERLLEWRPDDLEAPREQLNASILLRGGSTAPWIHYSNQPMHFLIAVFRPDALQELFGLEASDVLNKIQPFQQSTIGQHWKDWAQQIMAAGDSRTALPILYQGLDQQAVSEAVTGHHPELAEHWLARLQGHASSKSQRTLQRRISQLTGTNLRQLRRFIRIEQFALLVGSLLKNQNQQLDQADLAAEVGFSDQPHMAREVKRITGFSVGETLRRFLHDESFWLYRTKLRLHI